MGQVEVSNSAPTAPALCWDLHRNQTLSLTFQFTYCSPLEEKAYIPKKGLLCAFPVLGTIKELDLVLVP